MQILPSKMTTTNLQRPIVSSGCPDPYQLIKQQISEIDQLYQRILEKVYQSKPLKKLQSSWIGVNQLTSLAQYGSTVRLKILSATKKQLREDLVENDLKRAKLYHLIVEQEYNTPGGEPYSVLSCDYYFDHSHQDVALLRSFSHLAEQAHCPVVTAPSSSLFGINNWSQLPKLSNLEQIFDAESHSAWRSLRQTMASRYLVMSMPAVLAREPYQQGKLGKPFFQEPLNQINDLCWMNSAYLLTACIIRSVITTGWTTAIRGFENGGKIENLPMLPEQLHQKFKMRKRILPVEIAIHDQLEKSLSNQGFMPLSYYKNTCHAVYFGGQTLNQAKQYDQADISENAAISARLPFVLATARFAHYLKVIARDKIGGFLDRESLEQYLNQWISQYVNANPQSSQQMKAKYPLADAKVNLQSVKGSPGSYQANILLKPWIQFESLSASIRLVADLPARN